MTNTTNTNKKTNGRIKRTLSAALAAVMMMSMAATFAASADDTQAVVNMNTNTAMTSADNGGAVFKLDDDLMTVKNVTTETLFKIFEECTEYGKFFSPAINAVLDLVFGSQPDPTQEKLDQIDDKIDKLFDRIDSLQDNLISAFGNDMGIQSFYETFTAFKSQTRTLKRKITEISKDTTLTKLDKIAKIGSLAGTYSEWDIKFENIVGQLNELIKKPSFAQGGNIFELTYKHYCSQSMFSGEAIDRAKPLCDSLLQLYIAGTTTITECLAAQLYISQLPKQYQDRIDPAYKSHICLNSTDIINEIKSINEHTVNQDKKIVYFNGKPVKYFKSTINESIFPADSEVKYQPSPYAKRDYYYIITSFNTYCKVTPEYYTDAEVAEMKSTSILFKDAYDTTFNRSRRILVNKNANGNGREIGNKAGYDYHRDNIFCNGKYRNGMSQITQDWFAGEIEKMTLSFNDAKAMANYCRGKGITIRTLLSSVGINTSEVPQNANLITSDAFDGSNSEAQRAFTLFKYEKTYYKGINIDQVGAGEQQYQLLDCGFNGWKLEGWSYGPDGAFCWI